MNKIEDKMLIKRMVGFKMKYIGMVESVLCSFGGFEGRDDVEIEMWFQRMMGDDVWSRDK